MTMVHSFLKPPPNAAKLHHPHDYIMKINSQGKHVRKIFYKTDFDEFEIRHIKDLVTRLKSLGMKHDYDEPTLLRMCYSGDFKLDKCIEKIKMIEQWNSNPHMQTLSDKGLQVLESGVIYTYGRDYQYRPIIVLNLAKIDNSKFSTEDFYNAMNALIKPIIEFMFLPGKIQNWVIIIDTEQRTTLPVNSINSIIDKLSTIYTSRLDRMFIVNVNTLLRAIWAGVKQFVHEETLKKIEVLGPKDMHRIFKHLPISEVEKKYGGKLDNLTSYWPIKTTGKIYEQLDQKISIKMDESVYESVDNNEQFFLEDPAREGCCGADNKCLIF